MLRRSILGPQLGCSAPSTYIVFGNHIHAMAEVCEREQEQRVLSVVKIALVAGLRVSVHRSKNRKDHYLHKVV